jgi:DNA-binding transcriptional MerR regulator
MNKSNINNMKDKFYTISDTANILGVHPNTLRNWEKKNILVPSRKKGSNYRLYSQEQLNSFLIRGSLAKIQIHWGYKYSKQARIDEVSKVRNSLDVIVSSEATSHKEDKKLDKKLSKLWSENLEMGINPRFIRDLSNPRMREISEQHKRLGIKTKDRKVAGFTVSIRDRKAVRIEIPNDNPDQRLNLLIDDKKVATSFTMLFDRLWKK